MAIRCQALRYTYGSQWFLTEVSIDVFFIQLRAIRDSGDGSAAAIGELIAPGPVFFVTDAQLTQLGLADRTLAGLRVAGREVTVFEAVEADPSRATLESAAAAARAAGAALVVGFGGGSPMDLVKLVAYLAQSCDDLE